MYSACVAKRKNYTFRLDPDVVGAFAKVAEGEHRSINNMVEVTMIETLKARGIALQKPEPAPDET